MVVTGERKCFMSTRCKERLPSQAYDMAIMLLLRRILVLVTSHCEVTATC